MRLQDELRRARGLFLGLTFYEAFEHAVVLVLTLLIVLIVLSATWHLALAVFALIVANQIAPKRREHRGSARRVDILCRGRELQSRAHMRPP